MSKSAKSEQLGLKDMIFEAIKEAGNRKGASLPAINKFLAGNFNVDVIKKRANIKLILKNALKNEEIKSNATGMNGI
jgi:hypothetical protein